MLSARNFLAVIALLGVCLAVEAAKSCAECRKEGHTHYCTGNNGTCHGTEFACKRDCNDGKCVRTLECDPLRFECSEQEAKDCGAKSTCCINAETQQPFCSAGEGRTCCNFRNTTCEAQYACDPIKGICVAPKKEKTRKCKDCETIVEIVKRDSSDESCREACRILIPPFKEECEALMRQGLCEYIKRDLKEGKKKKEICESLGDCSETTCRCGYCTPSLYGIACIAEERICPRNKTAAADDVDSVVQPLNGEYPAEKAGIVRRIRSLHGTLFSGWQRKLAREEERARAELEVDGFCRHAHCKEDHAGCCLSC